MTTKRSQRPRIVLVNRAFVINKKGELLLLKRSSEERVGPGMWEIPGGKLDEGQDISHALEREVLEETNLLVTPVLRTGYFESEIIAGGPYKGMPYIVIVGISKIDLGTVKISSEHDEFRWVKFKDFEKYELRPEIRKAFIVLKNNLQKVIKDCR
jgi:8-oxo-dGTP pyrophosphatase MutT (NUDIX family)